MNNNSNFSRRVVVVVVGGGGGGGGVKLFVRESVRNYGYLGCCRRCCRWYLLERLWKWEGVLRARGLLTVVAVMTAGCLTSEIGTLVVTEDLLLAKVAEVGLVAMVEAHPRVAMLASNCSNLCVR